MKVIGLNDKGEYIAIVSHTELEKCAGKYYGKLEKLKVGYEFDIGAGHDFANDIKSVCNNMTDAVKKFGSAQDTMIKFAVMVNKLPDSPNADPEGGAA